MKQNVVKTKNFKPLDLWYLLLRTMFICEQLTYSYVFQWKSLLIQIILYIMLPLILTTIFNPNIGIPDGCYSFLLNRNTSYSKQLEND
jgi:hypothetical protein